MAESLVKNKSFKFAVKIVNLYKMLCDDKKEFVLSKQLLRSGTSVGANINEALQGQSRKDFLAKMNIALKEIYESYYWLELLSETKYLTEKESVSIKSDCDELKKCCLPL
ncbi:MAG: four helix bundle protein [Candidatus Desantisbacteria bacterium]